jgi:hypothetical protein
MLLVESEFVFGYISYASTDNSRNECAREWKTYHPDEAKKVFEMHWKNLTLSEKEVSPPFLVDTSHDVALEMGTEGWRTGTSCAPGI